jgi:hypothetical protein
VNKKEEMTNLPITHIFTLDELQHLAAREVLRLNGVKDPVAYTSENSVQLQAAFRLDANVMAITVLSSTPAREAEPIPLVSK